MTKDYSKIEILSPAGNPEKLKFAVTYGADAVYCAADRFGMRAAADNFSFDEIKESIAFAHSKGVKVYITVNTMPRDGDLKSLPGYIEILKEACADAFIVADAGVSEVIKSVYPDAVLHLSTQASVMNSESCRFWYKNGFRRIVLARELSLEDIKEIRKNAPEDLELEAFVHGAMCMAYSGRCLLSSFYTGRSANEGRCAQPCRWEYHFAEHKRPEDVITVSHDESGSYIFSSRDMCMIEHLKELADAGVDSFKIEGRVKSAYYTAAVTNAYRLALEDVKNGKEFNPDYLNEVESVSHREYSTGFFFSSPSENENICKKNEYIKDRAFLCTVDGIDRERGLVRCIQRNKVREGDCVQILSPGKIGRDAKITQLFNDEFSPIESAPHPKQIFYIALDCGVNDIKENDIIRAV